MIQPLADRPLLLRVAAGLVVVLAAGLTPAAAQVEFHNEEVLHDPTADGVLLTMLPAEPVALAVSYGNRTVGTRVTPVQRVAAEELAVFRLDGLAPDQEYTYRVYVKTAADTPWVPRNEHTFRTLRSEEATFSFAVMGDTHAWSVWTNESLLDGDAFDVLRQTLKTLRDDTSLDFVVGGTDHVMTVCGNGCKSATVSGLPVAGGSSPNALDAELRYRRVFSPTIYGRYGRELPMLYVLGCHDGERGWGTPEGTCGYTTEQLAWSSAAREKHVPNASLVYPGNDRGTYYSVRTGDVLLVVLDVDGYTTEGPSSPETWTLGERQLAWLQSTLVASDATFKIVFAEHIMGGITSPSSICWKARGGLKSTGNGQINGTFLGEQALIHEIIKAHGAQVFFSFHDHCVVWAEKVDEDFLGEGVTYVIGGRASGISNGWTDEAWYRDAMDYDNDGVPEYMTDVTGTRKPGWFKVTVVGKERMEFQYLRSAVGAGDGEEILAFTIEP